MGWQQKVYEMLGRKKKKNNEPWRNNGWKCPELQKDINRQIKVKCGAVKSLSRVRLCDPMDCSPPGSSVHEIFQARVLEWVAISFSRGPSWPRVESGSPALQADILPSEPPERRRRNQERRRKWVSGERIQPKKEAKGKLQRRVKVGSRMTTAH